MIADVRSAALRPARAPAPRADAQGAQAARAALQQAPASAEDDASGSDSPAAVSDSASAAPGDRHARIAELRATLESRQAQVAAAFGRVREHIASQQVEGRALTRAPASLVPGASHPVSSPSTEDSTEAQARTEKEAGNNADGVSQRSRHSGPGRDSASRPSSLTQSHPDNASSSTLTAPITPKMSGASRPSTPVRGEDTPSSPGLPAPRSVSPKLGDTQHISRGSWGRSGKSARPPSTSSWKRTSLSAAVAGAGRSLWRTPAHLRTGSSASSSLSSVAGVSAGPGSATGVSTGSGAAAGHGHTVSNSSASGLDSNTRSVTGPAGNAETNSGTGLRSVSEGVAVSDPPPAAETDDQTSGSSPQEQDRAHAGSSCCPAANTTKPTVSPATGKANGLAHPPISTGAVIRHLTNEVQEAKENLASTQRALVGVQAEQRDISRSLGDAREARARAEEDVQAAERMLARRERLLADARDRLRGAEHKARTLGAASREKGTRLRELEAKLGQQRREAARQEAAYEALRAEWDAARSSHRRELAEIKKANAQDAEKFCAELTEHKSRWEALTAPSTTAAFAAAATSGGKSFLLDGVAAAVASLRAEQDAAALAIGNLLDPLVAQAHELEERDNRVEGELLDTLHEIRRLHRLALAAP